MLGAIVGDIVVHEWDNIKRRLSIIREDCFHRYGYDLCSLQKQL